MFSNLHSTIVHNDKKQNKHGTSNTPYNESKYIHIIKSYTAMKFNYSYMPRLK